MSRKKYRFLKGTHNPVKTSNEISPTLSCLRLLLKHHVFIPISFYTHTQENERSIMLLIISHGRQGATNITNFSFDIVSLLTLLVRHNNLGYRAVIDSKY